jgi:toxic protein SymE
VTVKISAGGLTIIADSNEVQELRKQVYQVKKVIRDIKEGISGVLTEV